MTGRRKEISRREGCFGFEGERKFSNRVNSEAFLGASPSVHRRRPGGNPEAQLPDFQEGRENPEIQLASQRSPSQAYSHSEI